MNLPYRKALFTPKKSQATDSASGIISSYPKTAYAKQAGDELVRDYGFKKLPIRDPYKAPIGAVLDEVAIRRIDPFSSVGSGRA